MMRGLAVVAAVLSFCGLGACDQTRIEAPRAGGAAGPEAATSTSPAPSPAPSPGPAEPAIEAASETATTADADPAAPGAPIYAALYPGARLDAPATTADGDAGAGGLVAYTTQATPEQVVAFYRTRAEKAGLTSVMGMNQGRARAYGATDKAAAGASVQVVAAPDEAGETSVQLSWSEGR